MNVEHILSYVCQKGVVLIPDGNRIRYKAPTGIMTPYLVEAIRKNKRAILGALAQRGGAKEILHKNTESKPGDCDQCPAAAGTGTMHNMPAKGFSASITPTI